MPEAKTGSATQTTILVIDDDELVCNTMENVLDRAGYGAISACDAQSGLDIVVKRQPDLILCDVMMPGMDGEAFVRSLREDYPDLSYIPVIFLSGQSSQNAVLKGLQAGADDYLTKPVKSSLLVTKIETALRQVGRMKEQKRREEIKLYKALTKKLEQTTKTLDRNAAADKQPPAAEAANAPVELSSGFKEALSKLPKTSAEGENGGVQYISFDEFSEAFGDNWPAHLEKAMSIADKTIQRHMVKGDIYSKCGKEGFILVFPTVKDDVADTKARLIADEIRVNLMGADASLFQNIEIGSARMERGEVIDEKGEISSSAIKSSVETRLKKRDHKSSDGAAAAMPIRLDKVIETHFRPIWFPERRTVIGYQCYPYRKTPYGIFFGSKVLHGGDCDPLTGELDCHLTHRVLDEIEDLDPVEDQTVVFLSLHFNSVMNDEYWSRLRGMLEDNKLKCQQFLAAELISIPGGLKETQITDAMERLRGLTAALAVEYSHANDRLDVFAQNGASILTTDVSKKHDFGVVVDAAGTSGMGACLLGVDRLSILKAALEAGFTMMAGRVVAANVTEVGETYTLTEDDVFENL